MLVALVVLAYGNSLGFGYIWDDHLLVQLDLPSALELSFQGIHVRPIWYLSYVLSQQLASSAAFEHFLNLALFAIAAVLAHRVALEMLGRRTAAWVVTLVWALLPWNAYPVAWIAQRNDLLIFIFGFAAILSLRHGKYALAWLLLALALFSKVTIAFLPLFFIWQAHRRGHDRAAMAFGALFVTYLALATRAYALYVEPAAHLESLAWSLRLLRFPLHWLEHLALLAVPIPFFLGTIHALLYLAGLVGVLLSSRARTRRGEPAPRQYDALKLAILASLMSAVTPELRICGFESLFWLIAIAEHRRWHSPFLAASALTAMLAAYSLSIAATKTIFDTRLSQPATEQQNLYPNDYYQLRRGAISSLEP